jgi:hypothetical protein
MEPHSPLGEPAREIPVRCTVRVWNVAELVWGIAFPSRSRRFSAVPAEQVTRLRRNLESYPKGSQARYDAAVRLVRKLRELGMNEDEASLWRSLLVEFARIRGAGDELAVAARVQLVEGD